MTAISDKGPLPDYGAGMYEGFDHIHWWVGNARMFADWWVDRFGFTRIAYRGLETGSRDVVTHVISNGRVVFAVSSQLNPVATMCAGDEMGRHLAMHGDGVKDVAFRVTDCARVYASLVGRGGVSVSPPTESVDAGGRVIMASVATYGDTIHTLVERKAYHGPFLPGYRAAAEEPSAIATCTPKPVFEGCVCVCGGGVQRGERAERAGTARVSDHRRLPRARRSWTTSWATSRQTR